MEFAFRQELFDYPYNEFRDHLDIKGNTRILFSGKFGIGKSYFLNHFFKEETQIGKKAQKLYEAFTIYPVNYSIASNEDVFRYIKYDIIMTMLEKRLEPEESDFEFIDTLPDYLRGNLTKVMATLIYMIPKIGKDIYGNYEKLEELRQDFQKHAKQHTKGEGDQLISYLERIENKEGSLFDNDVITKLIQKILARRKKEKKIETVLVIDDLDRIDPEHVFRLLNVFAAHLNQPSSLSNKLGFDKVIMVCDIQNLRNIFRAKYGGHTDFNGYIDKFYSYDIFHFDNRKILEEISYQAFKSVWIVGNSANEKPQSYESFLFNKNNFALDLCRLFIQNGLLNLRNLIARINNKIEIDVSAFAKFDELNLVPKIEVPLLIHFEILKEFVGGYDVLKENIQRISRKGWQVERQDFYGNIFMLFTHHEQTLRTKGDITVTFNNKEFWIRWNNTLVEGFDNLVICIKPSLANPATPIQYHYSFEEMQLLVTDFTDLLKRIDS
jgi:GTP-binding protein EngB required for normal cell division